MSGPWLLFLYLAAFLLPLSCVEGSPKAGQWRPVVLMHGLVADKSVLETVQGWIQADFPGIYVNNVEIGNGMFDSLFMNINDQVEQFAATVAADPNLSKGFNAICHSQGGLICRAYIERYNNPPVYNFLSWLGPQDGVFGVPEFNAFCPNDDCPWFDWVMDTILEGGWIDQEFQEHVSFAAYWKDPFEYSTYVKSNIFLSDINNEKPQKNATYKAHLTSLNKLLLLYSTNDTVVIPKSSPWFEFWALNSDTEITPLDQSQQYEEDWLGLQTLDKSGRLLLHTVPCGHHDIHDPNCKPYYDLYSRPLLNNTLGV